MKIFDLEKFSKMVHYVCSKSDPDKLGAIKLNKILWFSDIFYFLQEGDSITGEDYIKRQFGPVPKHILQVLDKLQIEGKICINEKTHYGYKKREYLSLKNPEIMESLSATEISTIDDVIGIITDKHTATSISEASHNEIWEMAEIGEPIPYEAVMVSILGEVDENDIDWAKDQILKKAA